MFTLTRIYQAKLKGVTKKGWKKQVLAENLPLLIFGWLYSSTWNEMELRGNGIRLFCFDY